MTYSYVDNTYDAVLTADSPHFLRGTFGATDVVNDAKLCVIGLTASSMLMYGAQCMWSLHKMW